MNRVGEFVPWTHCREILANFRDVVEADLRRAARVIIRVQDEIDPQFRIATPEGDYWLAVTLPAATSERRYLLGLVSVFMAWKQAVSFTLASELADPDCVYCVGVAYKERHVCLSRISRRSKPWADTNFGAVEWLHPDTIDEHICNLLPRGSMTVTGVDRVDLNAWFGSKGRFPALHIPTGQVRGVE